MKKSAFWVILLFCFSFIFSLVGWTPSAAAFTEEQLWIVESSRYSATPSHPPKRRSHY